VTLLHIVTDVLLLCRLQKVVLLFRNNEMCAKFLVDMHGIDVLMQLIQTPNSPLFHCTVLALSHQARHLQLTSPVCEEDSAATGSTECDDAADAEENPVRYNVFLFLVCFLVCFISFQWTLFISCCFYVICCMLCTCMVIETSLVLWLQ